MAEQQAIVVPLTLDLSGTVSALDRLIAALQRCADDLRAGVSPPEPVVQDDDYEGRVDRVPSHRSSDPFIFIEINRSPFRLARGTKTGAEIRALPCPPIRDTDDLWLIRPGDDDWLVRDDDTVDLGGGGLRFFTAPKHINAG